MDDIRSRYAVLLLIALAVLPFLPAVDNYYFYDDGRVLREAVRVDREGAAVIFEDGFNGHFRPLPVASAWVVGRTFGFESPRTARAGNRVACHQRAADLSAAGIAVSRAAVDRVFRGRCVRRAVGSDRIRDLYLGPGHALLGARRSRGLDCRFSMALIPRLERRWDRCWRVDFARRR